MTEVIGKNFKAASKTPEFLIKPRHMLETTKTPQFKEWLRERHQTNLGRVFFDIVLIYSIIAGAIYFSISVDTWWAYLLSVFVIGSRLHALGVLVHEGTHYTLSKNKYVNDLVSDLFCAFPIFISTRGFRAFHLPHHRHTRTELDPELIAARQDPNYMWPKSPLKTYSMLILDITGLNFHALLGIMFIWSDALGLLRIPKAKWIKLKTNEAMAEFLDRTDPKFKLSIGLKLRIVLFYGLLATALTYFGIWKYYLLYWIVPAFSVLAFIIRIRGMTEHNGLDFKTEISTSRTTLEKNPVLRHFLTPLAVNYHLEHHLYPQVPYFYLKELHSELKKNPEYLTGGGISYSYLKNLQGLTVPGIIMAKPDR